MFSTNLVSVGVLSLGCPSGSAIFTPLEGCAASLHAFRSATAIPKSTCPFRGHHGGGMGFALFLWCLHHGMTGEGGTGRLRGGPGPLQGRTAPCRAEPRPTHLISGWAGELPSAGCDLTNKGNLIWSSLMPTCQQTLRGEPLSAAPAFCFIGSQKLCLIRVTYSPGPPRSVSSTYQHLAKWSGKAKINIPAKTHNSKILIDSEAEHCQDAEEDYMALVLAAKEPALSSQEGISHPERANIRVPKPLFINSLRPCSHMLRDDYVEADLWSLESGSLA